MSCTRRAKLLKAKRRSQNLSHQGKNLEETVEIYRVQSESLTDILSTLWQTMTKWPSVRTSWEGHVLGKGWTSNLRMPVFGISCRNGYHGRLSHSHSICLIDKSRIYSLLLVSMKPVTAFHGVSLWATTSVNAIQAIQGYIPNYSHLIGIMIINHWI